MLEVNRPNRAARRLKGKSDPLDAYHAAQSILDGRTTAIPKAKDGPVECLRDLRAARTSAVKARTAAINQIKGLLVTAPDKLRARYRTLGATALITALQRTRPSGHMGDPTFVCLLTLKALATRCQSLSAEITATDAALQEILDTYAPMLCDLPGVGTEVASQLLGTVGRRGRTHSRILGQNHPPPAQQRRRPQCQPRLAFGSPCPNGFVPTNQELRD